MTLSFYNEALDFEATEQDFYDFCQTNLSEENQDKLFNIIDEIQTHMRNTQNVSMNISYNVFENQSNKLLLDIEICDFSFTLLLEVNNQESNLKLKVSRYTFVSLSSISTLFQQLVSTVENSTN